MTKISLISLIMPPKSFENKKFELENLHNQLTIKGNSELTSCINYDIIKNNNLEESFPWCEYCQADKLMGTNCKRYNQLFENISEKSINSYLTYLKSISPKTFSLDIKPNLNKLILKLQN